MTVVSTEDVPQRRLIPSSFLGGVPDSGRCNRCNKEFFLKPLPGETLKSATYRFLTDFQNHVCGPA